MKDIQFTFDTDRQKQRVNPWKNRLIILVVALLVIGTALFFLIGGSDEAVPADTPQPIAEVGLPPVEQPQDRIETPVPSAAPVSRVPFANEKVEGPAIAPEAVAEADRMIGNEPLDMVEIGGRKLSEITGEANELIKKREYVQARKMLEPLLKSDRLRQYSSPWLAVAETLGAANIGLFFSDIPFAPHKVNHTVKRGDTLDRIANQYKTTIEGVQKSNGIPENSSMIRVGDNLRVYSGDWRIVVSRTNHLLMLYDGDALFKVYRIGIGKQERTPNGTFVISSKVKEPEWYAPDGRVIPFGDGDNLLGTRWLALQHTTESGPSFKGLGIHGTWKPETIGTNSSNGCVRMRNAEVEELYAIVPRLTPVEITD
jgi:LysM repeat protein